jgi:hypothetical protein
MRKTIHIILIMVFSLSVLFIGTGCNTAELEDLTKKIEEVTSEIESTTATLQEKENEVRELQGNLDQLEAELSALKAAKNLMVFLVGEDGAPLTGASVILSETGEEIVAGDDGTLNWMDLAGDTATLSMDAQGYFPKEESVSLQEGTTGVLISMERDLNELLPSEACAEGETLVYIEDFQDGMAQGWPEVEAGEEGYLVGPDPDEENNLVMSITGNTINGESVDLSTHLKDQTFDNSVWRFKVKYSGKMDIKLNTQADMMDGSRYFTDFNFGSTIGLSKIPDGGEEIKIDKSGKSISANRWYTFEVSKYEGVIEVWIDGQKIFSYDDPEPLPEGYISINNTFHWEGGGASYYNDMSVCELSAPFVSIFGAEE